MEENLNQKREKKAFQESLNKDSKKKGIFLNIQLIYQIIFYQYILLNNLLIILNNLIII